MCEIKIEIKYIITIKRNVPFGKIIAYKTGRAIVLCDDRICKTYQSVENIVEKIKEKARAGQCAMKTICRDKGEIIFYNELLSQNPYKNYWGFFFFFNYIETGNANCWL